MSKGLLGRWLWIVAILAGISLIPAAAILAYYGFYMLTPRYSAVADFDALGYNLRLDLYLTDDDARDSGRYLSVINGGSYHTVMVPGWDWSKHSRTSLYSIDANHLAVLGALGNDYKITLTPFDFAPIVSEDGEQWHYLGAFDFAFSPAGKARLEFLDPQTLAECIPMGLTSPATWSARPRAAVRRANCPVPKTD